METPHRHGAITLAYEIVSLCFDDSETHFTHRSDYTFYNIGLWMITWKALTNIRFYALKWRSTTTSCRSLKSASTSRINRSSAYIFKVLELAIVVLLIVRLTYDFFYLLYARRKLGTTYFDGDTNYNVGQCFTKHLFVSTWMVALDQELYPYQHFFSSIFKHLWSSGFVINRNQMNPLKRRVLLLLSLAYKWCLSKSAIVSWKWMIWKTFY